MTRDHVINVAPVRQPAPFSIPHDVEEKKIVELSSSSSDKQQQLVDITTTEQYPGPSGS